MVRRLSGGRAEMLLAGVRESWSGRNRRGSGAEDGSAASGGASSSNHSGISGSSNSQGRRLSPWSRFSASNRDEAEGNGGVGNARGERAGGTGRASFGTLELFNNLDIDNLAPAAGDDSDEEMQRTREEEHVGGQQRHSPAPRSKEEGEHEARRSSEGDKEQDANSNAVVGADTEENRRKSDGDEHGGGSASAATTTTTTSAASNPQSRKVPAAATRRVTHRVASMGFMSTRATGSLNYAARTADNNGDSPGSSPSGSPGRPDYSRAKSAPKSGGDDAAGGQTLGASYRSDPRASRSQHSSSLTSSINSQVDPRALAILRSVNQDASRRGSNAAWNIVEAELEAIGSSSKSSGLDAGSNRGSDVRFQDDRPEDATGSSLLGDLWSGITGGAASRRNSEEGAGWILDSSGAATGRSVAATPSNAFASSSRAVVVPAPLGGTMPKLAPGKNLDCRRSRDRTAMRSQRRRSTIGCAIAAVALVAAGGAAIVLVRSGDGGHGGGGNGVGGVEEERGGESASAATAAGAARTAGDEGELSGAAPGGAAGRRPKAPPIPPNFLDMCSPSNVSSAKDDGGNIKDDGYEACRSVCQEAECCYLPPSRALSCTTSTSTLRPEERTAPGERMQEREEPTPSTSGGGDPCETYVRVCAVLDDAHQDEEQEQEQEMLPPSFDEEDGSPEPAPRDEEQEQHGAQAGHDARAEPTQPPPPDLDLLHARCNMQAIQPASGYSKCWDLCEDALCCFEGEEGHDGIDPSAMAMVLEGRSSAAAGGGGGGEGEGGSDAATTRQEEAEGSTPCRDDCELYGPCRSLLQVRTAPGGDGSTDDHADDVYVVEEEDGAANNRHGKGV